MNVDPLESAQALRLQRFYLAQSSYLIAYIVLTVTLATGSYMGSNAFALSHYLLGFATQLIFLWMLKSGFNLRFKDPSLTSPQIIVALLLQTYLLALAGPIRSVAIIAYCLILLFGVFQLSRTAYIAHALLALMCYGTLIGLNHVLHIYPQDLSIALLEWFVLAYFLFWLTFLGSYIRELRQGLRQRHDRLLEQEQKQQELMEKLETLAATDSLTNLANRRHFMQEAQRRLAQLPADQTQGLAMIDLDNFKRINDRHGHAVGDEVLQGFARLLTESLREEDMVARFGGEEFILLLNNCDLATLHHCVERIRLTLQATPFPSLPEGVICTLSAGLCLVRPNDDLSVCIDQADEALYQAKGTGRNRSNVHQDAYMSA